ncbi:MAG: T9SS type A sorting domain-containing protein [candidate division Zixibacteria bacterium]|nr:T9SS type A sorting domain-containing protein [candidate division Zixibacteria bacterium]
MNRTVLSLLLLLSVCLIQTSVAHNVDYLSSTLWTEFRNVKTQGDYAYCDFQNGLMVLDISNPSSPEFESQLYLGGNEREFGFSGDYIFVANGNMGVKIVDKSDPGNLEIIGSIETDEDAKGIAIHEDYAFITVEWEEVSGGDIYDEVLIYDISSQLNPVYISSFSAFFMLPVNSVFVRDSTVFITYSGTRLVSGYQLIFGGVALFDIEDIGNPQLLTDYFTYDNNFRDIFVDGNFAYVTHRDDGLLVFDATYPQQIFLIGTYDTPGWASDITVQNDIAYIADRIEGLHIVNVETPSTPEFEGQYNPEYFVSNVWFDNYNIYTGGVRAGMEVIDVTDPSNPQMEGTFEIPDANDNVFIAGDYAYVAQGEAGMQIVDISNPLQPELLGSYSDQNSRVQDIYVDDHYAYLANFYSGLQIIDISNPNSPIHIANHNTPDQALSVQVDGQLAYIADGSSMQIIDVSDPHNPSFTGSINYTGYTVDVYVLGNFAYAAVDAFGLRIIDVSDPGNPILEGTYNTTGSAKGVFVKENLAYVADGHYGGLKIVDIENSQSPFLVTHVRMPERTANDVVVSGSYAYVAASDLMVVDVSDPELANITGSFKTPKTPRGIALSGNDIYIADDVSLLALNFAPSDIHVSVIPEDQYLEYSPGGTITYTGVLKNNTNESASGDVWISVELPDGSEFGPVAVHNSIPLNPNETQSLSGIEQQIPNIAPEGYYSYIAYTGTYPNDIMDSSSFQFRVTGVSNRGGNSDWSPAKWLDEKPELLPQTAILGNNYPNPFNAHTKIRFTLPSSGNVNLSIFNLLGQKMTTLVDGYKQAGQHTVTWDASNYSSGIYFYKLTAGDKVFTKRMMLLK